MYVALAFAPRTLSSGANSRQLPAIAGHSNRLRFGRLGRKGLQIAVPASAIKEAPANHALSGIRVAIGLRQSLRPRQSSEHVPPFEIVGRGDGRNKNRP